MELRVDDLSLARGGVPVLTGMSLTLKAGQALIREMVPEVDVVIHNFRPGVMDKLGLGSDALRALNSGSISNRSTCALLQRWATASPTTPAPAPRSAALPAKLSGAVAANRMASNPERWPLLANCCTAMPWPFTTWPAPATTRASPVGRRRPIAPATRWT